MKLRKPESLRTHKAAIALVFVIVFLVAGIWAFQLTQFFQGRVNEAPEAVVESQARWNAAVEESEDLAEDLPAAQGDFGEATDALVDLLEGEQNKREALNQLAEDLLNDIDNAQAEEETYAEEE